MSDKPSSPPSRWRRGYFPIVWLAALGTIWLGFEIAERLGRIDRDVEMVAYILLGNLAWLGLLVWGLFRWPRFLALPAGVRWGVRGLTALMVVLVFSSLEVEYDGDTGWRRVRWRWAKDPDQRLEAIRERRPAPDWGSRPNDYPRFLGGGYWAEVKGVELDPDWKTHPPEQLWRKAIGAGWSSFAVVGPYAITQEQRGPNELVTCYEIATGEPVWSHADESRHDPDTMHGGLGGVGPRATPTVHGRRIYTYGARGIANCLDGPTGEVVWTRRFDESTGYEPLLWGNSSSPLVLSDLGIVVYAVGKSLDQEKGSLVALDLETGETRWESGVQTTSYASPVAAEIGGVEQVVHVNESSVGGYRASDGEQLWEFEQPGQSNGGASCSQPIPLDDDRVFVSKGYGEGARLAELTTSTDGSFEAKIAWKKPVMQTKFSNVVVRDGYAYGLDQGNLACIEIATGKREWRKRRQPAWGHGQVLLVGDLLLVLTETGEGVLVECQPEKFVEVASQQLLAEEGITWNHPVIVGDTLLVRNGVEAAAYRLQLKPESDEAATAPAEGEPAGEQ